VIAYVEGKILAKASTYIIIETGGIGYKINTGSFPKGEAGQVTKFFCFHYIREDTNELYGFSNNKDLELFELFLTVSGVGPKVAQTIINQIGRERSVSAIEANDINTFKSVSGVGTKVAAKIIVELKNKLTKGEVDLGLMENDETLDALLALGLKKMEILPALKTIPAHITDTQERVKFVLKNAKK